MLNNTPQLFAQVLPGVSGARHITLEQAVSAAEGYGEGAIYGFAPVENGWQAVAISFDGELTHTGSTFATLEDAEADEKAFFNLEQAKVLTMTIDCPQCGSVETECNTFEAWCYDCDWHMTKTDPRFADFREAHLLHRIEIFKILEALFG